MKHLKHKTMSIYKALNDRYEKMDSKLPAKSYKTYIPQEKKGEPLDKKLNQNLMILATGFIVDEIP